MKIYTKTGDNGVTSLWGGKRVPKIAPRVMAYGAVDELNSYLGVVLAKELSPIIREGLGIIQQDLMVMGSDLATPMDAPKKLKTLRIQPEQVEQLEKQIDLMTATLPRLTNFIVPGGSSAAASIHCARALCRRVEREVLTFASQEDTNANIIVYLNRLSDWLFTAARYQNLADNADEVIWNV